MWTLLENNGTLYYWDLNLKKESFNFDEKMKKCFKNGRPKIQSEYCCIAKSNMRPTLALLSLCGC